jgi:hypothetical protein
MTCYIIRKMRMAHCKRGPLNCEKCREVDVERICLLDICPPDQGKVQRPVIEVETDGEVAWCEFDVVKVFESKEEALTYAASQGIEDVEI